MRVLCSNNGGFGSRSHPLVRVCLELCRWMFFGDVFGRRRLYFPGGWLRRRRRLVLHLCEGVGASSTPRLQDLDSGRWPRWRWRTVALAVLTGADADGLSADWLRLSASGSSALAALHVLVRFGGGSRRKRRSAASCSSVAASGSSMRPRGEPRRTWKQQ